jgi:hypothetical protein
MSQHSKEITSRLTASVVLLVVLAAGLLAGLGGCGGTAPVTAPGYARMTQSAGAYLNDSGRELSKGKTTGASVYKVSARLDTSAKTVSGSEQVLYTNRSTDTLSEVVFRVYANDEVSKGTAPVRIGAVRVDARSAAHTLDGSLLSVSLPAKVRPGGKASISFTFSETIPPVSRSVSRGIFAYSEGTYDLGNFLPTVVMYSQGKWDTRPSPEHGDVMYYDCSYYEVSFEAPQGYTVASTGAQTAGGPSSKVTYAAGPVRDFEVQASNDYLQASKQAGPVTVTSYYTSENSRAGKEALDYGVASMQIYSQHFGPYPYTRYNVCEAPILDDGMEFTGQVQISSGLYESPEDTADLESCVAHETCHQWWALGVGSDSIGRAWQDESLTSFCEALYYLWHVSPEEFSSVLAEDMAGLYTATRDEGVPDAPMDLTDSAFADDDQYTAVVYGKGAMMFDALRNQMGAAAFEKALAEYYARFSFLNASPDDMIAVFKVNSPDPAATEALFARWLHGTYGDEDIK